MLTASVVVSPVDYNYLSDLASAVTPFRTARYSARPSPLCRRGKADGQVLVVISLSDRCCRSIEYRTDENSSDP